MTNEFFNVINKKQTYLNMLYLLLSFPLGIAYFIILTTGIATGVGLIITLLGIPLLILMTFIWYGLAIFERILTVNLLNIKINSMPNKAFKQKKLLDKIKKQLMTSATWKELAYLFIKFPLGIVSFVALTVLLSVSISLILTPLIFLFTKNIPEVSFMVINGTEIITNYWQTGILTIIGIFLLFVSLHILNAIAYVSGLIAELLLTRKK